MNSGLKKLKELAKESYLYLLRNSESGNREIKIPKKFSKLITKSNNNNYELLEYYRRLFNVGITGGKFEIVHPGHIKMLKKAKEFCDILIVVIANDKLMEKIRSRKTILNQEERKEIINSIKFVDFTFIGKEDRDFYYFLNLTKPDIIFYGYDQKAIISLEKLNFKPKVIRLPKFGNYNTSNLISKKEV